MHVLDLIGIGLSVSAASADGYRQFSAFAPWTVVKKRRDLFVLYQRSPGVYVSLGNSKFQIPAGEYATQLSIHGSAIVPATSAMSLVLYKLGRAPGSSSSSKAIKYKTFRRLHC
jgi:hypothetical protein